MFYIMDDLIGYYLVQSQQHGRCHLEQQERCHGCIVCLPVGAWKFFLRG